MWSFNVWWEATAKEKWPVLRLSDQTFDQSHDHHTFITTLFCGVWMLAWGVFDGFSTALFQYPFALGIVIGIAAYVVREIIARFSTPRPLLWDQALDVLKQEIWLGPYALAVFNDKESPPAWWIGAILFFGTLYIGYLYTWGRWPQRLHYDQRKDK